MNNLPNTPDGGDGQPLPDCPELAMFVAGIFQRLGGRLAIDGGQHIRWRPEPAHFRIKGEELPQLPDAKPWEEFHSADEWRGALKVAEYWLTRLSPADRSFVYTYFAPTRTHAAGDFDFRDHLQ